jgi:hypothetical protein
MADDEVTRNLEGMDELDFTGWNGADWNGVFAHYHTNDVLVDVHGQPQTHGIQEHIDAMKAFVEATGGATVPSPRSSSGCSRVSEIVTRRASPLRAAARSATHVRGRVESKQLTLCVRAFAGPAALASGNLCGPRAAFRRL